MTVLSQKLAKHKLTHSVPPAVRKVMGKTTNRVVLMCNIYIVMISILLYNIIIRTYSSDTSLSGMQISLQPKEAIGGKSQEGSASNTSSKEQVNITSL